MRNDLLPQEIIAPLEALFDRVPPESLDLTALTISEELNGDPRNIFAKFQTEPVAAGSFATVYRAELQTGGVVAVKVQRRDIDRVVRRDLKQLTWIAGIVDFVGVLKRFRLSTFVAEFARWTQEELDYEREGRNMEYLRQHSLGNSIVVIPSVHWELTKRRVITMEFFDGIWLSNEQRLNNLDRGVRAGYASELFSSLMHDIFELGFFHADPHPGNLCILPSGRIGLIDFGIIGFASEVTRRSHSDLLWAIERNDLESAFDAIVRVLNVPPDADIDGFHAAFEDNVRNWLLLQYQPNITGLERSGGQLLIANFQSARAFGLTFKAAAARYYRAFVLVDTIVTRLDPDFRQLPALAEYFRHRFLRWRVKTDVSWFSSFDFQMVWFARAQQLLSNVQRAVSVSAGELVNSVVDQTLLRFSGIAHALAYLSAVILTLSLFLGALLKFIPSTRNVLDSFGGGFLWHKIVHYDLLTISAIALLLTASLAWLSRILWINAYRGNQITPAILPERSPRRVRRSSG
jgi:ubiquinone biosynthesis protein